MTGVSRTEMDRRIHDLAQRAGIGGKLTVRHIPPTATQTELDAAAATVLAAMRNGRPTGVGQLTYATGLTRPTVANAVRALATDGRIVLAGSAVQAMGGRQRMWIVAVPDAD